MDIMDKGTLYSKNIKNSSWPSWFTVPLNKPDWRITEALSPYGWKVFEFKEEAF